MEHVVNSFIISDGKHYPLLNYGDVVLVHEFGYGLIEEDEDKYVQILDYESAGYYDGPGYRIKPYDCELETQNPGENGYIGVESFGSNPTVLLNVRDDLKEGQVKIEVLTAEFNYQGLYKGTVIDNAKVTPNGVEFKHNGKNWLLDKGSYLTFKKAELQEYNRGEEYTGSSSSYYKIHIATPVTAEEPYDAECLDIIEALEMTWGEANVFKATWRKAAARKGLKKKGNTAVYDAEKMVFFSQREEVLERAKEGE